MTTELSCENVNKHEKKISRCKVLLIFISLYFAAVLIAFSHEGILRDFPLEVQGKFLMIFPLLFLDIFEQHF
jgi:hypothetical protein